MHSYTHAYHMHTFMHACIRSYIHACMHTYFYMHTYMRQRGFTPHRLAIPREGHVNGINHEHIIVFRADAKAYAHAPAGDAT